MSAVTAAPSTQAATVKIERGKSYWNLVWQQFRKRREAFVALYLLGGLFLMALTAPLLANNLPWCVSAPEGTSFPLIRDFVFPMGALDRFYNHLLITLTVCGIVWIFARKLAGFTRARLINAGLAMFVVLFGLGTWMGGRNDTTDYKQLAESGKASVLFSLNKYGSLEDNPIKQDRAPDGEHRFGCDNNGFDVMSRIIHGSRVSLAVGFLAVGLAVAIGVIVGSLAGFFGGWVDLLIARVIEIFICFPSFFFILTIIAIAPRRSIFWVMLAIGLTGWMGVARLIRGEVLRIRQLDYVQAAVAVGASSSRIVFRHILPNALAPVLVSATFGVAGAILTETGLGFLGLGVEPPQPSWGELLNQARLDPTRLWWLTIFPGNMMFISVTLMNLVGEGLRDAMDPKMRR